MRSVTLTVVVACLLALAGCNGVPLGGSSDGDVGTDRPGSVSEGTSSDTVTATPSPEVTTTRGPSNTETETETETATDERETEGSTTETTDGEPTPVDSDSDGLTDEAERSEYGTDPTEADTDGDGLDDGPEVNNYGTDPTHNDTDGDNLTDGREVELGTDPTAVDTDSDGLDDGIETNETIRSNYLPGADPTHRNLYLNMQYRDECTPLDERGLDRIEQQFADAPVSNPDNETGIDLSITTGRENTTGYGYFQGAVVESLPVGNPEFIGVWLPGSTFWVECVAPDDVLTSVVMHELGHALGLNPLTSDEDGIDSESVSFDEYESVMNYNAPRGYLGYSPEDWETVERHMGLYVSTQQLE